ncbi:MAG: hypothetical protein EXR77_18205 [Myxococcales bacterium]|nr:hypothetical protein [Myxococcales bacterium]
METATKLTERVAELERLLVAALAESAALRAEVKELKARLGLDSSNSSRPPSTDSPFKAPPPKPPTGKKPGAQPGRLGKFRRLAATPDKTQHIIPCSCEHCGTALTADDLVGAGFERDVVDIEVHHHTQRIVLLAGKCPKCRKTTRAKAPVGTPAGTFGPKLQAAIALLTMHGTSRGDAHRSPHRRRAQPEQSHQTDVTNGSRPSSARQAHGSGELS